MPRGGPRRRLRDQDGYHTLPRRPVMVRAWKDVDGQIIATEELDATETPNAVVMGRTVFLKREKRMRELEEENRRLKGEAA